LQIPTGTEDRRSAELLDRFTTALRDLHAGVRVVRDEAETKQALREILMGAGCKSVVVAGIPSRYLGTVEGALAGMKSDLVDDLLGSSQEEVVRILAGADAGVTWAVKGLALEGAILEVVYDDSAKLASSLPKLHVALLESSNLVQDLTEALPLVGEIVKEASPDRKPIISFISGPSKTGDIEMRLLYGVHGPHTVHVLILDWH